MSAIDDLLAKRDSQITAWEEWHEGIQKRLAFVLVGEIGPEAIEILKITLEQKPSDQIGAGRINNRTLTKIMEGPKR